MKPLWPGAIQLPSERCVVLSADPELLHQTPGLLENRPESVALRSSDAVRRRYCLPTLGRREHLTQRCPGLLASQAEGVGCHDQRFEFLGRFGSTTDGGHAT